MNPNESVLLLVDCENDFLSEKGALYPAVKSSLDSNDTINNLNRTLEAARQKGLKVIFTSMEFSEDYKEMGNSPYGILAAIKNANALKRETWGAKVAENIGIGDDDLVLSKSTMCAFKSTELEEILTHHNIKTLIFGGLVTDLCLETSIRSAYDLGFEVIALVDCMASLNQATHESTVADNFPLFSKPMLHSDFVSQLYNT